MHHIVALISLLFTASTSWISTGVAMNVLVSGPNLATEWVLMPKQYLNNSNFYLVMQPDCHLYLYNDSTPFLMIKLTPDPVGDSSTWNCYARMQADGHFVVYQRMNATLEIPMWASETNTNGFDNSTYKFMILGRDGSLSMYEEDGSVRSIKKFVEVAPLGGAPSPAPASSNATLSNVAYPFPHELEWKPNASLADYHYLPEEYFLSQGSKLQTVDERFTLKLGHDCNLQSQEVWSTNKTVMRVIWEPRPPNLSGARQNCQLMLQQDGRLEIRDNISGVAYWNSSVSGDQSVDWVLRLNPDDGHVTVSDILNSSKVLWTSVEAKLTPRSAKSVWPIVVGVVGVVILAAMAAWYFYVRAGFLDPTEKAFQRKLQSIGGKSQALSETKIKLATNNFGSRIGHGGFGDVFYGKLADGQEIAAKVLSVGSHQSKEEFYNEIELLSMVHHKYLVTLIGYCSTAKHRILIYEYMGGGDLRHRLSKRQGVTVSPLSWRQRTSITLQVAEGIEYLHDKCTPSIIHRDVKSNNILLTNNLVAKVADFGLSKLRTIDQENATHITTVVKGTPGYLDPEYHKTGLLTEKSDVYAFGIVMMEILTGQQQMSISERVYDARRHGNIDELVDPRIAEDFNKDEFAHLVDLSLWCVRKLSGNRPFIRQVVQRLREIVVAPMEASTEVTNAAMEYGMDERESLVFEEIRGFEIMPFTGSFSSSVQSGR